MECRFGGVSQSEFTFPLLWLSLTYVVVMQSQHVQKAQAQYCANVCMKLNAKLGGTTSRIAGKTKDAAIPGAPLPFFQKPGKTMILGADVSHPSPGSPQPSIAAVTMSADADCCRYAAQVDTNGHR
jgi:eukaryotic translation initiation factor 2C